MPQINNQEYLLNGQYRDSSNLDARMALQRSFSTNPQGWLPWVWDTLDELPSTADVLELGCGPGSLWSECSGRIPAGWRITLSDFSPGMLQAAWRNLVVTGRGFKFEQIDAQAIPYPDDSFDILIANHMLYHVPDRPRAIAEMRRVLRPGGRLVASTVGERHLMEMNQWLSRLGAVVTSSLPFTLENGAEQLRPFFSGLELRRYSDNLRIRELPPLMAYLRSSIRADGAPENILQSLEGELAAMLEQRGEIFITKDSGLFLGFPVK